MTPKESRSAVDTCAKLPSLCVRSMSPNKKKKITHCLLLGKLARANVCSDPRNVQQAGAFENNLLLRRSDTPAELQINLAPGFARMTTAALKCN